MKIILMLVVLLIATPAMGSSLTFTLTADQVKGAIWACSGSTFDPAGRDPDGDKVFTACTAVQTKAYAIERFKVDMVDDWKRQRDAAVNSSVNLKVVFRDATIAQKCSAMTSLGIADPDSHLPVGEVCP